MTSPGSQNLGTGDGPDPSAALGGLETQDIGVLEIFSQHAVSAMRGSYMEGKTRKRSGVSRPELRRERRWHIGVAEPNRSL